MRLINADKLEYTCNADECGMLTGCNHCQYHIITEDEIDKAPIIKAIPIEVFDKIRAEIEQTFLDDGAMQEYTVAECQRIRTGM